MVLTFEQAKEKAKYEQEHKITLAELKNQHSENARIRAEKSHKERMAELNIRLEIAKIELKKPLAVREQSSPP